MYVVGLFRLNCFFIPCFFFFFGGGGGRGEGGYVRHRGGGREGQEPGPNIPGRRVPGLRGADGLSGDLREARLLLRMF